MLGKHSWIFYARADVFEDFFGMRPFSEDELRRCKRYLEGRREAFARRNARYLFSSGRIIESTCGLSREQRFVQIQNIHRRASLT